MLSEHTLKAIDIVCEEFDSEFKEQVTKHLQGFYKRMQRGYYSNQYGLCFNLQKMLSTEEIWLARACSAVLSKSFDYAGLDVTFPFNNGKGAEHYAEKDYYKNPKRLAWIASNVSES